MRAIATSTDIVRLAYRISLQCEASLLYFDTVNNPRTALNTVALQCEAWHSSPYERRLRRSASPITATFHGTRESDSCWMDSRGQSFRGNASQFFSRKIGDVNSCQLGRSRPGLSPAGVCPHR